jgi:GWxTD domain-containing protein
MKTWLPRIIGVWLLQAAWLASVWAGSNNQSEGTILFYTDHSYFKMINEKGVSFVQLHFFMARNQLTFVKQDTFFVAKYSVRVHFADISDKNNILDKQWAVDLDDHIMAADTAKDIPIMFENSFVVKPGKYAMKVEITDNHNNTRYGKYSEEIEISSFDQSDLMISNIELATQVLKSGHVDEMFVKNGYTIYPNPSKFYGSNLPRLWLYAELYNLQYEAGGAANTYSADFIVTDEAGTVVKEYPSKTFNKGGATAVLIHSINVISLSSGRYHLLVRATDNANKKTAQMKKEFIVFREGESMSETQADDSFFKELDEAGAVRAGNIVSYVGKDDDKKIYSQLDLEGKRKFLDRFWKERDPSPGTKSNEALVESYKRYSEANDRFSTPNIQGWKTDMGRVYIVYGPPAQIEKHEFESDKKPYQIWYYLQLKGERTQTMFVFAEIDDSGLQRLIHSDVRGEMGDPNWQRRIQKME